ncbi:hypothetical protein [uncultured Tenacibaculum sp.]|uniref:hypothetical protein n=1 Tax=uncultured Tenacibaculum sp. TaxID=174713 RepID=UPI0026370D3E|nr:hypothetical protein [uncultured Tenacibaculum sp.]
MLKSIINLGTVLNKADQLKVNGGNKRIPDCPDGQQLSCHPLIGCHCEAIDTDLRE